MPAGGGKLPVACGWRSLRIPCVPSQVPLCRPGRGLLGVPEGAGWGRCGSAAAGVVMPEWEDRGACGWVVLGSPGAVALARFRRSRFDLCVVRLVLFSRQADVQEAKAEAPEGPGRPMKEREIISWDGDHISLPRFLKQLAEFVAAHVGGDLRRVQVCRSRDPMWGWDASHVCIGWPGYVRGTWDKLSVSSPDL